MHRPTLVLLSCRQSPGIHNSRDPEGRSIAYFRDCRESHIPEIKIPCPGRRRVLVSVELFKTRHVIGIAIASYWAIFCGSFGNWTPTIAPLVPIWESN